MYSIKRKSFFNVYLVEKFIIFIIRKKILKAMKSKKKKKTYIAHI